MSVYLALLVNRGSTLLVQPKMEKRHLLQALWGIGSIVGGMTSLVYIHSPGTVGYRVHCGGYDIISIYILQALWGRVHCGGYVYIHSPGTVG